jgi:hypothetical protein
MQCDRRSTIEVNWAEERGLVIQVAATRSTRAAMLIINARSKGGSKTLSGPKGREGVSTWALKIMDVVLLVWVWVWV